MTAIDNRPEIAEGATVAAAVRLRRPLALRHSLAGHPLLSADAVAELADLLGSSGVVREAAVKPVLYERDVVETQYADSPGAAVRDLDAGDAWLTLLNIERDPRYRDLVDELIDGLAGTSGIPAKLWFRRMGFVFASSPHSVTGAHFDVEHSLQLQLRGNRVVSFGEWPDAESRAREVTRYWNGSFGKLAGMPVATEEITVGPGQGCYIPPYRPHWLRNGDTSSLSLTVTFFNRDNDSETRVNVVNERLRRLGRRPRPYGASRLGDAAKITAGKAMSAAARLRRTAPTG